jgi:hypothetical protein
MIAGFFRGGVLALRSIWTSKCLKKKDFACTSKHSMCIQKFFLKKNLMWPVVKRQKLPRQDGLFYTDTKNVSFLH